MIKKLLVTFALSVVALPAFAQTPVAPVARPAYGEPARRGEVREAAKERVAAVRVEAKDRLAKVRDEKKRAALERVEKELARLNARMTEQLTKAIDQIDRVLTRVSERVNKAQNAGRDVAAVLAKVDAAKSTIAAARARIVAQAAKTYSVNTDVEAALRQRARETRELLRADLTGAREVVKAARTAVHDVAVALAQVVKPAEKPATTNQ